MSILRKDFFNNYGWTLFLNLILPPRCSGCGDFTNEHHQLCQGCWSQLEFISSPSCKLCGWPLPYSVVLSLDNSALDTSDPLDSYLCGGCLKRPPSFDKGLSSFVYKDMIRQLIIRFKHGDATYLAPTFAKWLYQRGKEELRECDYLIPVPLHRWRLFKRQYNQATLLARHLGDLCDIPILTSVLERSRHTASQHQKGRKHRETNVENAFCISRSHGLFRTRLPGSQILSGKTICLIDDVWTTGATIGACSKVLYRAGVKKIIVLTLARVV